MKALKTTTIAMVTSLALTTVSAGLVATHPGEEIGYILEGSILLEQDGKPPVTLTAGQTFFIPNGQVHNATNKGSSTARVLANYVVESGKPVATPVPAK